MQGARGESSGKKSQWQLDREQQTADGAVLLKLASNFEVERMLEKQRGYFANVIIITELSKRKSEKESQLSIERQSKRRSAKLNLNSSLWSRRKVS